MEDESHVFDTELGQENYGEAHMERVLCQIVVIGSTDVISFHDINASTVLTKFF